MGIRFNHDIVCSLTRLWNFDRISKKDFSAKYAKLIRSDHPSNNKRGGVAIYFKNFLPLKLIDVNYLTTSEYNLKQVINEPTHLLENSSSCIDLIFTS